jgi:Cof subfamily protein (haloacid dehalogenase superfamily)
MIRMLASDLDGTLLRSDGTVSDRTRAAIEAAAEAGLVIAFVTGRPPRWLHEVADATGHNGVAASANGALIYDLHTETVVTEHPLQPTELTELTERLRTAFPAVRFALEYGLDFGFEPGYLHQWEISPATDRKGLPFPAPFEAPLAEVIARPGVKLLAKDRDADPDEFLAAATALLGRAATVTCSSSIGLLEIAAPGVTKATGLAEIAATHGIGPDEIAAIGDMPNDVPMLEWVGESYAVANAHPAARAAAGAVVGSNDDDAVAVLIESVLARRFGSDT